MNKLKTLIFCSIFLFAANAFAGQEECEPGQRWHPDLGCIKSIVDTARG